MHPSIQVSDAVPNDLKRKQDERLAKVSADPIDRYIIDLPVILPHELDMVGIMNSHFTLQTYLFILTMLPRHCSSSMIMTR
jgi:hypothetical protein